ncbi:MAG TPA: VCBS repeat-containing protein [Candidatus Polarisedimenticolaceae bacterium]|nr:VCBS repeat-containing protein [Candidatus Polarisedimenticolaceae bacterium]
MGSILLLVAAFSEVAAISTSGGQTITVFAADIDRDGDQDVVSAEYGANLVAWYENSGAATPAWTKRIIDSQPLGPMTVALGDLDRDGDIDVLSANFNEEGVVWYENRLPNTGWTKRFVSGITGAWGAHVADVDGDGDLDGIGGNRVDGFDHRGVEWYENNGAVPPSFTIRAVSTGFVDAASVHAADVDGDGDTDILADDVFRDSIYYYRNSGDHPPSWTQVTISDAVDEPWSVFPADLDHDGDVDVLSASGQDNTIAWHENDGRNPPGWSRHVISNQVNLATAVSAKDLDGDADLDVISGAWANDVSWFENDGNVPPSFTRTVVSNNCSGVEGITAARLDPDADVDLLAACNIIGTIHWYRNEVNFADADADGVRNEIDCSPGDATVFAIPGEVRGLKLPGKTTLAWASAVPIAGSGTVHDVLRGSLDQLPVASKLDETCLIEATTGTTLTVAATPNAGAGFSYLLRAENACGLGSYGFATPGTERTSDACP